MSGASAGKRFDRHDDEGPTVKLDSQSIRSKNSPPPFSVSSLSLPLDIATDYVSSPILRCPPPFPPRMSKDEREKKDLTLEGFL